MKFSIGDKVLLKQTDEEGVITAILSGDMFEILVNGTTFPVFYDEIDHPYLKWFTEKNKQNKKKVSPEQLPVEPLKLRQTKLPKGFYLSFLPVYVNDSFEDIVSSFKIYMLNELPIDVHFSYEVKTAVKSSFSHQGKIPAFNNLYLHNLPFDEMNEQPRFVWTISDADNTVALREATGVLRIKPAQLFTRLSNIQLNNEPTFNELLAQDLYATQNPTVEIDPILPKPVVDNKKKNRKLSLKDIPRFEIDLHIEQLVTISKGLSNAEILHIQLSHLRNYLNTSIAHSMTKVVIIHGVGKGVLRDAVHKVLKEYPQVDHYTNEWHGSYGFGATQVFLTY